MIMSNDGLQPYWRTRRSRPEFIRSAGENVVLKNDRPKDTPHNFLNRTNF